MSSIDNLPCIERDYYVYAMMCQDDEGPLYIKFGKTMNLSQRLIDLRVACPIPLVKFGVLSVKNRSEQTMIEKALHTQFASRRAKGEWFRFDVTSESDKVDFRDGCAKVFAYNLGPGHKWQYIDGDEYLKYVSQRRAAFLHSRSTTQLAQYHRRKSNARKASKELSNYRQY